MCITFTVVAMLKTAAYFAALAGDKRRLLPLLFFFLLLPLLLPFVVGASAAATVAGCGCCFCCIKINIYARQLVQSSTNAIVFIRQQRASINASFCPCRRQGSSGWPRLHPLFVKRTKSTFHYCGKCSI